MVTPQKSGTSGWQVAGIVSSIASCAVAAVALFFSLHNASAAQQDTVLKAAIKLEVGDQLKPITTDVAALKTDLASVRASIEALRGNVELLLQKGLQKTAALPAHAFDEALPQTAVQLQAASQTDSKLPSTTLAALAQKLTQSADTQNVALWQASTQLVSYRSSSRPASFSMRECFSDPPGLGPEAPLRTSLMRGDSGPFLAYDSECVLNLDQPDVIFRHLVTFFSLLDRERPRSTHVVEVEKGIIIYSGQASLPGIQEMIFNSCQLRLVSHDVLPSATGRSVIRQMLASNSNSVRIVAPAV